MPVKIRLQRHGKKGKPFYWIVAADARANRDGRFLEKLGVYNPNTNPATIEINLDHSVKWLENGAQPSETARRILSYKGVLLKHHLNGGVRKGALTEEQAEKKFQAWVDEKDQKITSKSEGLEKAKAEARAKALEAEKEVSEKRKAAAVEAEAPEAPEAEVAAEEAAVEAAPAPETEAAEEAASEAAEAPAAEAEEAADESEAK
jgi:small subunit ribosomal protein S16